MAYAGLIPAIDPGEGNIPEESSLESRSKGKTAEPLNL
jgi:hypothetical protein